MQGKNFLKCYKVDTVIKQLAIELASWLATYYQQRIRIATIQKPSSYPLL